MKPFFFRESGLYTNIGFTESMSIFFNLSYIERDSEKNVLKAFVAEYRVEYGAGF